MITNEDGKFEMAKVLNGNDSVGKTILYLHLMLWCAVLLILCLLYLYSAFIVILPIQLSSFHSLRTWCRTIIFPNALFHCDCDCDAVQSVECTKSGQLCGYLEFKCIFKGLLTLRTRICSTCRMRIRLDAEIEWPIWTIFDFKCIPLPLTWKSLHFSSFEMQMSVREATSPK